MEKLPQLTIARGEVCVMVRSAPDCRIDAAPDVTTPLVGRMFWAFEGATATTTATAMHADVIGRIGLS